MPTPTDDDKIKITTHGDRPIEFYGDQEGEIGVSSWIPSSPHYPFYPGFVTVAMALGSLARSSDMANPRKGENLCYVAALPLDKIDDLIGRLLAARALIPGAAPTDGAEAVRLLHGVMHGSDRAVDEANKRLPALRAAFGLDEDATPTPSGGAGEG